MAGVRFAEEPVERIQTVGPEALIEVQPLMGARERSGIEPAQMCAAPHLAAGQTGALASLDVLRRRRERDGERLGKLADGAFAAGELAEHLPARGVAEGVKNGIELRCL